MEIESETIPSKIQKDIYITPGYPVSTVDMFIDISVGHKMPT
jgi:hypothetical protein